FPRPAAIPLPHLPPVNTSNQAKTCWIFIAKGRKLRDEVPFKPAIATDGNRALPAQSKRSCLAHPPQNCPA
ncbi:hypothetical protein, partial [Pseudomonas defluvii]|uniref:hypothetical protein n=1 Tax=Pseudomonas defluvii TaxID=1876757 RepID=UPI003905D81A